MASTTFLQQAYLAYFGRPADAAGLLTFGNDKVSEASVIASFSASAESQQFFGSMDTFQQINTIYKNLYGQMQQARKNVETTSDPNATGTDERGADPLRTMRTE